MSNSLASKQPNVLPSDEPSAFKFPGRRGLVSRRSCEVRLHLAARTMRSAPWSRGKRDVPYGPRTVTRACLIALGTSPPRQSRTPDRRQVVGPDRQLHPYRCGGLAEPGFVRGDHEMD